MTIWRSRPKLVPMTLYPLLLLALPAVAADPASDVAALSKAILERRSAAEPDLADRFFDQIWAGGYLAPAARTDPALADAVRGAARDWVKSRLEGGGAESLAKLYFVLGSGGRVPSWAGKRFKGAPLSGFRTEEWMRKMRPWTEKAPQSKGTVQPGRLEPKHSAGWPAAFLQEASVQAERLAKRTAAPRKDADLERLGEDLSASRAPARGELRRFKKARELIPPPIPKLTEVVPQPVEKIIDPVLKPVDAVTQEGIVKPVEKATQPKTP